MPWPNNKYSLISFLPDVSNFLVLEHAYPSATCFCFVGLPEEIFNNCPF